MHDSNAMKQIPKTEDAKIRFVHDLNSGPVNAKANTQAILLRNEARGLVPACQIRKFYAIG